MGYTVVLVVRQRHGNDVSRVSGSVAKRLRALPPMARGCVPARRRIKFATCALVRGRAIWHANRLDVEERLSLREPVDVLPRVLRPRSEAARDRVWLDPNVRLDPAPALASEGEDELVHVRVPLAVHDAILDVQNEVAAWLKRRQHRSGERQEPLDVLVRIDPGVVAKVRVGRRHEEQIDGALGDRGKPLTRVAPGHAVRKQTVKNAALRRLRRSVDPTYVHLPRTLPMSSEVP